MTAPLHTNGSEPRAAGSVGATGQPPGRPKAGPAPSGGSEPRAAGSVGAPPFSWPVRVYWEDTDAGGIVFYANYLKFFERARTEWLRSLGMGQQALRDSAGGLFVVSDAELHYRRPARLDDRLRITAALQSVGHASLVVWQQAWLQPGERAASGQAQTPEPAEPAGPDAPEQLLCDGQIRVGWVDAATLRPRRMPPDVLARIGASPQKP